MFVFHSLLFLVCALVTPTTPLSGGWIDYTTSSGVYCSTKTELCHTLAHYVLWAVPGDAHDAPDLLQGVGYVSVDGSEYVGHSQLNYEQHNIWVNDKRAQVFNLLYHRTWFLGDKAEVLPNSICAKALIIEPTTAESIMIDEVCAEVEVENMFMENNKVERSWYLHGNSTKECSVSSFVCRVMAHIVIRSAAAGVDPMDVMKGGGEFSLDGGATWSIAGDQGLAFESQIVLHTDGQLYQGGNVGFELVVPYTEDDQDSQDGQDVCWRIWVMNTVTGSAPVYVDMGDGDGGYMGYQISQYERCFHTEYVVHQ